MDKNKLPHEYIEKEGLYLFNDVFSKSEVDEIRALLAKIFEKTPCTSVFDPSRNVSNCSSLTPELNWVVSHEKLLSCIRQALNTKEIMYTSVLGIQKNMLSDWHKDDGTRGEDPGYFEREAYNDELCRVLRVGIYLQDHDSNYPGLYFRKGSHGTKSLKEGEVICIKSKPGDVVLFDVRLTHSGTFRSSIYQSLRRHLPNKYVRFLNTFYSIFRSINIKLSGKNKYALFTAFGLDNENTVTYSKNMMKNQLKQSSGSSSLPATLVELLASKEVACAASYFQSEEMFKND